MATKKVRRQLNADESKQYIKFRGILDAIEGEALVWFLRGEEVIDLEKKVKTLIETTKGLREFLESEKQRYLGEVDVRNKAALAGGLPVEDPEGCPPGFNQCPWGCSPGPCEPTIPEIVKIVAPGRPPTTPPIRDGSDVTRVG